MFESEIELRRVLESYEQFIRDYLAKSMTAFICLMRWMDTNPILKKKLF
jgi:hypothetical protein